jgi:tripartite-type tricarboxylate transporter receptor subunit TctC
MKRMRVLTALTVAATVLAATTPAFAAGFPERPINLIVPFPPGGASDTAARVVQAEAEKRLGQSIVIENRAGATGNIGANAVAKAAPDGYTLLCAALSVWSINPALFKSLPYDAVNDFDKITVAIRTPNALILRKTFPANTLEEFIAYLKANPGKVSFASSGAGSSDHLTAELFWQKTGTQGTHVPYKGGGPAITDLIGGHADASFVNLGSIAPQVKDGKVKAIAVTSEAEHPMLPGVKTLKEQGVDGVEVYSWQALGAPKGLPDDVRAKLETAFTEAYKTDAVKAAFAKTGFEVVATGTKAFEEFQAAEIARWKQVVAEGKIEAP